MTTYFWISPTLIAGTMLGSLSRIPLTTTEATSVTLGSGEALLLAAGTGTGALQVPAGAWDLVLYASSSDSTTRMRARICRQSADSTRTVLGETGASTTALQTYSTFFSLRAQLGAVSFAASDMLVIELVALGTAGVSVTLYCGSDLASYVAVPSGGGGGGSSTPLSDDAPTTMSVASASAGTSTAASRGDHRHAVSTGTPVAIGGANSAGTSTALARADHVHAGAGVAVVAHGSEPVQITTLQFGEILEVSATDGTASVALGAAHLQEVIFSSAAPQPVTLDASSAGVGTTAARLDHLHHVYTGVPVSVGTANAAGTSTNLARSDHVHALDASALSIAPIILAAGNFGAVLSVFTRVGGCVIDLRALPLTVGSKTLKASLAADVQRTSGTLALEVQLVDLSSSGSVLATLSVDSTNELTELTSALTLGTASGTLRTDAAHMYELQLRMTGGTTSDQALLSHAAVVLYYE
jgi:hypothetical protein